MKAVVCLARILLTIAMISSCNCVIEINSNSRRQKEGIPRNTLFYGISKRRIGNLSIGIENIAARGGGDTIAARGGGDIASQTESPPPSSSAGSSVDKVSSSPSSEAKLVDVVIESYQTYIGIVLRSRGSSSTLKAKDNDSTEDTGTATATLHPISKLAIPKRVWLSLTGREFNSYKCVEDLSKECYRCCIQTSHDCITWKPDSKTTKLLHKYDCNDNDADISQALLFKMPVDTVLLWTARLPKDGDGGDHDTSYYGSHLPLVRTRGLIKGLSPLNIAQLLMDSSRVKTYNKLSLGREDVTVFQNGIHTTNNHEDQDNNNNNYGGIGETKIVKNLTKPPLLSKNVRFLTMMHARPLQPSLEEQNHGYIVVSRAVSEHNHNHDESSSNLLQSEILLGVNLLRNVPQKLQQDQDSIITDLTSITHVNSPFVHPFVAAKAGLKGAVDFFNDVRSLGYSGGSTI